MRKPPRHLFGYDTWIEMFDTFCNENPDIYDNPRELVKVKLHYTYMTSPDAPVKHFKISMKQLMVNCWLEVMNERMIKDRSIIAQHHMQSTADFFHREYIDEAAKFLRLMQVNENF